MITFKEFKISDYITLKLVFGKTIIYVAGRRFWKCRFLLLQIPEGESELASLKSINSIDEAAEMLDASLEPLDGKVFMYSIPPETEFWGHCSNLQAWYENGYDTRLLHSNIAFPLLYELAEAGDPQALKVFKEEIAERYNTGIESVRKYLEHEYLKYLTTEEFLSNIDEEEFEALNKLRKLQPDVSRLGLQYKKGKITRLMLNGYKFKRVPSEIRRFTSLEHLEMTSNLLETLPEWIGELTSLKELQVYNNQLKSLPESFGALKSLQILKAFNNNLRQLPDSIGNLESLRMLNLHHNELISLPETVGNLVNLEELLLRGNKLSTLPNSIGRLDNLEVLVLDENELCKLPDSILDLENLRILGIDGNNVEKLPYSSGSYQNLRALNISNNPIYKMPDFVYGLPKLERLTIRGLGSIESRISLEKFKNKHIMILLSGQKMIEK
ncbi:hypothetical protein LCGC14_1597140 [marine sediment metagenome]|uniref:Disease resistance R13L4/SHOC-2-like LRR domain-containing protein n=1 Tax=marine sediment metagenome TaxID=412755 RepID=A0A0F9ICB5_9ZZZZ